MKFSRLPLIASVLLVGCVPPYAVGRFQRYSGLKVQPVTSFVVCRGTSLEPLECPPDAGSFPWVKVSNVPTMPIDIPAGLTGSSLDQVIRRQIVNKYLGAAYASGAFYSCMPESPEAYDVFRSILQVSPVPSTNIAQLVEETVIKEAGAQFDALARIAQVQTNASAKADFEASLRTSIQASATNTAQTKWVTVFLSADQIRWATLPQTKDCFDYARNRGGSLIAGVAGFVIMNQEGASSYVLASNFTTAATVALSGNGSVPLSEETRSAIANAAAQWSASTNRKISTAISTNVPEPTFYPLWVEFADVS